MAETTTAAPDDVAAIEQLHRTIEEIRTELATVVVGQDEVIQKLLICMLARGHALLMGVPGLAKTLTVNTLAECINLQFQRIQFTPDLLPADLIGTLIYNQKDNCCFVSSHVKPNIVDPVIPFFTQAGVEDRIAYHENTDPGTHNYDLDNRQQLYRFLSTHFLGTQDPMLTEIESGDEVLSDEQLQVPLPPDNASFHSLAADAARHLPRIPARTTPRLRRGQLREILRLPSAIARLVPSEVAPRMGFYRYVVSFDELGLSAAALVLEQKDPSATALVCADAGFASQSKKVKELLDSGHRVVCLDPLLVGQFGEPQALRAQHIAQRCGNRLVDDIDLFEPRPVTRLDRCSSLQLAELGRHGDHGPVDRSDLFVGGRQQFSEHVAGDVDRGVVLAVNGPAVRGVADVPLRILYDTVRADDGISQRLGADDDLLILVEENHRGRRQFAFLVGQGDRLAVLVEIGQAGIGCSQVNPDGVRFVRLHV